MDNTAIDSSGYSFRSILHKAAPAVGIAAFLAAGMSIHHEFRNVHYQELREAFHAISSGHIALAAFLTALGYFILTLYDVLAFRYASIPMPYHRLALVSFSGYALSNNVGYSFLSGGAIRYRLYSSWGVSAGDIARIIAFCTLTGWLGFAAMGGAACLLEPRGAFPPLFPAQFRLPLGVGLTGISACYLAASLSGRANLHWKKWRLELPSGRLAIGQVLVGVADLSVTAWVAYCLMSFDTPIGFPSFAGFFMLALLAGLVSQVPGGLGVFETVLIACLTPYAPSARILTALIVFRVLYYLTPLLLAVTVLGIYELAQRRIVFGRASQTIRALSPIAPDAFAFLTLIAGCVLLLSGASPPASGRIALLESRIPLPLLETSHFAASLVGVALLLVARALQRRVDAAYWGVVALLLVGIVVSLVKGLDYEEAVLLGLILAALLPCRGEFYRKGSLLSPRLGLAWTVGVAMVLASSFWLGLFAHKHVEYSSQLWWQFEFSKSAPRSLRAAVGVGILVACFGLTRLLRPAPAGKLAADTSVSGSIRRIIATSTDTCAFLALLGDKRFVVDTSDCGFIMYNVAGRCAVAMGDPVGPESVRRELAWQFRELCDRQGLMQVFYEVRPENLYLYADLGLMSVKIGEEAHVNLASFSLDGSGRKTERHILNRLERESTAFHIVEREEVPALLPELETISNDWLRHKKTREKGFSLGFFDPKYLVQFRHAILRQDGRIVAFANLFETKGKEELSIDLMRHSENAPAGVMDYLFLRLMLWGKEQGFQDLNLGMAPLSGIEKRQASPLWNRVAALVFEHGERFYNFQGLRRYKEKFHPEWQPRYVAAPARATAFPQAIASIAKLVNRGIKGSVAK
ncbi:MAG TPA: bifunctional lysylphosphatidylglycerol flippase/synthetase MprF [Candidatus Hydrogenedentes bacterium]|nr:bifunctional lysylphosphatidylglycerol flippase/synthetase MprF [Candidatus Hydrogenedentota bacterium]